MDNLVYDNQYTIFQILDTTISIFANRVQTRKELSSIQGGRNSVNFRQENICIHAYIKRCKRLSPTDIP